MLRRQEKWIQQNYSFLHFNFGRTTNAILINSFFFFFWLSFYCYLPYRLLLINVKLESWIQLLLQPFNYSIEGEGRERCDGGGVRGWVGGLRVRVRGAWDLYMLFCSFFLFLRFTPPVPPSTSHRPPPHTLTPQDLPLPSPE